MIVDCISDLHGHYPELEGGDLLIVAGDLTARDCRSDHLNFLTWLETVPYEKLIFIAGNHDNYIQKYNEDCLNDFNSKETFVYLCDSGTEFEGLRIWGSPWTLRFPGMNPHCMAFTMKTEEELACKWAKIPEDTDILVTHSPISHYLDKTIDGRRAGSGSLRVKTRDIFMKKGGPIKLHVCGHIHESYGQEGDGTIPIRVNASHVNERYEPVNKPIRVVL